MTSQGRKRAKPTPAAGEGPVKKRGRRLEPLLSPMEEIKARLAEIEELDRERRLLDRWPRQELDAVLAMTEESRDFAIELCKRLGRLVGSDDELYAVMRAEIDAERLKPHRLRRPRKEPPSRSRYLKVLFTAYLLAIKRGAAPEDALLKAAAWWGVVKDPASLRNDLVDARKLYPPEAMFRCVGPIAFMKIPPSPRSRSR